jgi:hypothetical protein
LVFCHDEAHREREREREREIKESEEKENSMIKGLDKQGQQP